MTGLSGLGAALVVMLGPWAALAAVQVPLCVGGCIGQTVKLRIGCWIATVLLPLCFLYSQVGLDLPFYKWDMDDYMFWFLSFPAWLSLLLMVIPLGRLIIGWRRSRLSAEK